MSESAIHFAHSRLHLAVFRMADSPLPARARLVEAVTAHVDQIFSFLDYPESLPPEIAVLVTAILTRLTEYGSYEQSVGAMTDEEVSYTIGQLVHLRRLLAQALDQEELEDSPG